MPDYQITATSNPGSDTLSTPFTNRILSILKLGRVPFTRSRILVTTLITLALLLTSGLAAAAKVYKWSDEDGSIHYSQEPPAEKAEEINVKSTQPVSTIPNRKPPEPASNRDNGEKTDKESKDTAAKNAEIEKQNEEIRKKNCKLANQQFMTINQGGRMYEVDEKGERHYWDDATRAAKLTEAQKSIEQWCKAP
jgi:hypothetical protein